MTKVDAIKFLMAMVFFAFVWAYWGHSPDTGLRCWLQRRKVRKQLQAHAGKSFKVDICVPSGNETDFGTMTFSDGTKIRGML